MKELNIVKVSKLDNSDYMMEAINLAKSAADQGEVPVGALIVNRESGKIISKAHNLVEQKKNPLMHAEILALNEACITLQSKFLLDCDIYVSLEPCCMCASAISLCRLGRVFYSASDNKQGAVDNGVRFYTQNSCFHRPEVYPGISSEISSHLVKNFFRNLRKNSL